MRARILGFLLILDGTVGAVFWLVVFESSSPESPFWNSDVTDQTRAQPPAVESKSISGYTSGTVRRAPGTCPSLV